PPLERHLGPAGALQPRLPLRAQRLPDRLQELRAGPLGAGDAGAPPHLPLAHAVDAGGEPGGRQPDGRSLRRLDRQHRRPRAPPPPSPSPADEPWTAGRIWRRARELGPREALRRAARKVWGTKGAPAAAAPPAPLLTDERTVAQLRALNYLLRHLDEAAGKR